jgi:hypothetical protein
MLSTDAALDDYAASNTGTRPGIRQSDEVDRYR